MIPNVVKPENDREYLFSQIKSGQTVCAMAAKYNTSCDHIKSIMDGQDGKESYVMWFSRMLSQRN